MSARTITEDVLVTMQIWNAELYQALEKRREEPIPIDDDRLLWIQGKLAREYQHIARMSHWACLERYESITDLVVPEQILDPEYDAVVEAAGWRHWHRDDLDILTAQARQMRQEQKIAERLAEPIGVRDEMPLMRALSSCACDVADPLLGAGPRREVRPVAGRRRWRLATSPAGSARLTGGNQTMTTTKITARNAKTLIGYTVQHDGRDHRIEDVRHMGRGGWMLALSNGALLRPGEIR